MIGLDKLILFLLDKKTTTRNKLDKLKLIIVTWKKNSKEKNRYTSIYSQLNMEGKI
jgi:hypothetical protein